jgi:tetratricopeptide (TPR) repeat protein
MKNIISYSILCLLLCGTGAYAQKKTFTRDYTYQASEADSKVSARAIATTEMRNILLREVGEFLQSEQTLREDETSREYSEKTEALTAGIVEMKTLDEQWNGVTYYIKAEMTVDPAGVNRRITEVLNDKQKTKELEEARKRTLAAETEAARLRKELEKTKNEQQRLALQKNYQQAVDALSAEEYYTRGNNALENCFNELAIEYYQKAIDLNPNYAVAYCNMGAAYSDLNNYREAIRCCQKAIDLEPNYADAYCNMGSAYIPLQDYRKAIQYFQKAIDLNPNLAVAYSNMGSTYYFMDNYREVIRCYQKAIDLEPNNIWAYTNMGNAYYEQGNKKQQVNCYKKAAKLGDTDAQEWLRKMGKRW